MKSVELGMDKNAQGRSGKLNTDIDEILDCAAEQGKKHVNEFSGIYKNLGLNWEDYFKNRKILSDELMQDLNAKNVPILEQKEFLCRMIHCVMDSSNGSLEELLIAAFS